MHIWKAQYQERGITSQWHAGENDFRYIVTNNDNLDSVIELFKSLGHAYQIKSVIYIGEISLIKTLEAT